MAAASSNLTLQKVCRSASAGYFNLHKYESVFLIFVYLGTPGPRVCFLSQARVLRWIMQGWDQCAILLEYLLLLCIYSDLSAIFQALFKFKSGNVRWRHTQIPTNYASEEEDVGKRRRKNDGSYGNANVPGWGLELKTWEKQLFKWRTETN
jgi:hypothetical protein